MAGGLNIILCKFCKRPFNSTGGRICPDCLKEIEIDLQKIKDYLYDNPGFLSVEELAAATEVSEETILYLIDEERLVFKLPDGREAGVSGFERECSECGRPIPMGTICDNCKGALAASLMGTIPKPEKKRSSYEKEAPKMHIDPAAKRK